jgi:hypothetical protein
VDYLNHEHAFVRLTSVSLPGGEEVPFFAIQRSAMILILPEEVAETGAPDRGGPQATETHHVTCLLEQGVVDGDLDLLHHIRVSDFFHHQQGFVVLKSCQARLPEAPLSGDAGQRYPELLVNANQIVGVTEPAGGS